MKTFRILGFFAGFMVTASVAWSGPVTYFEDQFDGAELASAWKIERPNPDDYLVDAGVLTLLVPDGMAARFGQAANILVLDKPVPKGNWSMTVRLNFTPQTMGEAFRIGVAKDAENGLYAKFSLYTESYASTGVFLTAEKYRKGKSTAFYSNIYSINSRNLETRASVFTRNIKYVDLRLKKTGHQYIAAMRLEPKNPGSEGAPSGKWRTVQKLTSLRPPGDKFVAMFGSKSNSYTPDNGEGLIEVESFKIETEN